jgi:hypothetical protein
MTKWLDHVRSVYQKKKKGNSSYKYSQALRDASKTWTAAKGKAPAKKGRAKRKAKKSKSKIEEGGFLPQEKKKRKIPR